MHKCWNQNEKKMFATVNGKCERRENQKKNENHTKFSIKYKILFL